MKSYEISRYDNNDNIEYIDNTTVMVPNKLEIEKKKRDDNIYSALESYTIKEAIESFLTILKPSTAKAYRCSLKWLHNKKIIDFDQKLSKFALVNYSNILGQIRTEAIIPATQQARAAALISFTKYLNSRTNRLIPRCQPVSHGVERTFKSIREKSKTKPMTRLQSKQLLETLKVINFQTYVIAFLALNSGRRISEVLQITWKDVNFEERKISFKILKLQYEKVVNITYSSTIFEDLMIIRRTNTYAQSTSPVFLRNNGSPVSYQTIWQRFKKASRLLGADYTPHCLRSTFVSIAAEEGKSHADIKACTGHSSLDMVAYYDRGSEDGSLTKDFSVV